MTNKFPPKEVIEKIFKDQEEHHKKAAKLPIEMKIRLMVNLQKALSNFNKKKEKRWRAWEI